jgi:ankyrin repeat protein
MFADWQYRPGRESEWGPPGLQTPTSDGNAERRLLSPWSAVCLIAVVGVSCWQQIGYRSLGTAGRRCDDIPSEMEKWVSPTRHPDEAANLEKWIAWHPADINTQYGGFCDTPLHMTARFGREDLAAQLIAAGADVEAQNMIQERPLHTAATNGHPAVVQVMLARGANVNASGPGMRTPLICAVAGFDDHSNADARTDLAKLLLAAGADVNAPVPGSRFTPLRYARSSQSGNSRMVELLLSDGADPHSDEEQE